MMLLICKTDFRDVKIRIVFGKSMQNYTFLNDYPKIKSFCNSHVFWNKNLTNLPDNSKVIRQIREIFVCQYTRGWLLFLDGIGDDIRHSPYTLVVGMDAVVLHFVAVVGK